MEAIEQLKTMRDQAKARIEALPDFKLMTKLTTLIEDLEGSFEESSDSSGGEASEDEEAGEDESTSFESSPYTQAAEPETAEPEAPAEVVTEAAPEPEPEPEPVSYEPEPVAVEEPPQEEEPVAPVVSKPVELDPGAASVLEELEKLTGSVRDGDAQHDVEHTPDIDPLDEVTEEALTMLDGANGAYEHQESATDDIELDTDSAIMQAMAELEADLGNADLDIDDEDERR